MKETLIFSPEEINELLRFLSVYLSLFLGSSIGTYTKCMLFPSKNNFKQWVGLAILASLISLKIYLMLDETSLPQIFLVCTTVGFVTPAFKSWFKGKKLVKIFINAFKKTNDLTSTLIDELGESLDKETSDDR